MAMCLMEEYKYVICFEKNPFVNIFLRDLFSVIISKFTPLTNLWETDVIWYARLHLCWKSVRPHHVASKILHLCMQIDKQYYTLF